MSDHPVQPTEVRDPRRVLGVSMTAGEDEIRAAYLRKVQDHPPDRSPEEFERIRDAYMLLRDRRAQCDLLWRAVDPSAPLTSWLDEVPPSRQFVGPGPWLAVVREGRR